ncbi:DUF3471 domain-containing protein [Larkinella terrae]|uniref:DUF3471 domain-containing protein n=1 Tax=Larkinella terrae TaxID=2025311 RepID=A0A7K0EJL2_9BACT|nr:DUF3471 domain-containing protein [Larkinella terrae]MRS61932.1 DUF3471 domain-containing protein [Larkinella terrae]
MKKLLVFAFALTAASPLAFASNSPVSKTATVQQADSTDLKAYTGKYTFAQNDTFKQFTITLENGDLYGAVDEYPKNKLVKQSAPETFKSTSEYGSIFTFTRDAATKAVTGFSIKIMGNELSATRDK